MNCFWNISAGKYPSKMVQYSKRTFGYQVFAPLQKKSSLPRKFWLVPKLSQISNSYILTKECVCLSNLIDSWKNIQNFNKKLHCQLKKREGFCFMEIFTRYFDRKCWSGQNKSHFLQKLLRSLVKIAKLSSLSESSLKFT